MDRILRRGSHAEGKRRMKKAKALAVMLGAVTWQNSIQNLSFGMDEEALK